MGWHDPQNYAKAMGRYAGCALHSTLQAHSGAFVFLVSCLLHTLSAMSSMPAVCSSRLLSTAAQTTLDCTQAAAPVMRDAAKKELEESDQAKQRCIINVSSTSGTHGNAGQANYSTVSHLPARQITEESPSVACLLQTFTQCASGLVNPQRLGL